MSTTAELHVLEARAVPLGGPRGMTVHRSLPARRTSLIGAWCFVDHFGPDDVSGGGGMQVARHPHTGLATVSWLFEGAITHRDSLGNHALVTPGDVDLMVAGSGITHSEFSAADTTVLHGVQLWYALREDRRFGEREFLVHSTVLRRDLGFSARVGLGELHVRTVDGSVFEDSSPVVTDTALTLAELTLDADTEVALELNPRHEHGILVDTGAATVTVAGERAEAGRSDLVLLPDGARRAVLRAGREPLRVLLLGGEPLGEDIVMWWNFVGRSHEEIAAFRARYQAEIGAADADPDAPVAEVVRERGGLPADAEQFGPFAAHTPAAIPGPELPNARLRSRGRVGSIEG